MATFCDDFNLDVCEGAADRADELLGDERVGASPDDQHGTVKCTGGGRIAYPVVPDVDVVGNHLGCDRRPEVGEPVELTFADVRRQFGTYAPLRVAVTAEGAERREGLVWKMGAAQRDGGEQDETAYLFAVLCCHQLGDLRAQALTDDDHRSVDGGDDVAGLGGQRLQRGGARIGDRSAARAEARKVIAHAGDLTSQ